MAKRKQKRTHAEIGRFHDNDVLSENWRKNNDYVKSEYDFHAPEHGEAICPVCDISFPKRAFNQKYCSVACRISTYEKPPVLADLTKRELINKLRCLQSCYTKLEKKYNSLIFNQVVNND